MSSAAVVPTMSETRPTAPQMNPSAVGFLLLFIQAAWRLAPTGGRAGGGWKERDAGGRMCVCLSAWRGEKEQNIKRREKPAGSKESEREKRNGA